jgi:hypothetical protein
MLFVIDIQSLNVRLNANMPSTFQHNFLSYAACGVRSSTLSTTKSQLNYIFRSKYHLHYTAILNISSGEKPVDRIILSIRKPVLESYTMKYK